MTGAPVRVDVIGVGFGATVQIPAYQSEGADVTAAEEAGSNERGRYMDEDRLRTLLQWVKDGEANGSEAETLWLLDAELVELKIPSETMHGGSSTDFSPLMEEIRLPYLALTQNG